MRILNFFDDLQRKGTELQKKGAELQKKADQLQKRMESFSYNASTPATNKRQPTKTTKPKPDRSIDGISKQILATRDNMVKNGFTHYEFMANSGCCEKCAALDGKHFRISNFKIGVNAPPMHEGCRCCITEWFDRAEYEAWLKYIEKGGTTAEWEARKASKTRQKGGEQKGGDAKLYPHHAKTKRK